MPTLQELFPDHFTFSVCTYDKDKAQLDAIWDDAVFVPDANILIDLYRLHNDTSKQLMNKLEEMAIAKRLFVPNQVAYEFLNNRRWTIADKCCRLDENMDSLKKALEDHRKSTTDNSSIQFHVDTLLDTFEDKIEEEKKSHETMKSWESDIVKDNVLQFINTKLSGCIGPGLTSTEMATLSSESVLRFTRRTPPGFMDRLKIGDLIIWNEILNFSAAYQKNMILITRDLKIDWWCNLAIPYRKDRRDDKLNEDEKKLLTHARHELMSEFKTRSGKLFDVTTSTTLSEKWKMSPAVRNELQHLASSDVFADLANLATDGRRARLGEKFVKYTDIVAFAKNHCDNVIKGRVNFDRTVIESLINNGRLLLLDYSNILNQNMIYEIGYLLNVVVNQLNKAQTEPNYFVILTSMISHLMTLLDNTEKLLTQKHLNQPYFNLLDILKSNTNPT